MQFEGGGIMALAFPGLDFFSQPVGIPFAAIQSAVPVFIGYTETGGAYVCLLYTSRCV